jgi:hypothetical protein
MKATKKWSECPLEIREDESFESKSSLRHVLTGTKIPILNVVRDEAQRSVFGFADMSPSFSTAAKALEQRYSQGAKGGSC